MIKRLVFICLLIGCNNSPKNESSLDQFTKEDYTYIAINYPINFSIDSYTHIDKIYSDSFSSFFVLYSYNARKNLLYIKTARENKILRNSFLISRFPYLYEYNDQREFNLNRINQFINDLDQIPYKEKRQIINRTVLLALLQLPRDLYSSKSGFNNSKTLFSLKNIKQLKSERDLDLYYNNLRGLKILYLNTNYYKDPIKSDYSFMLPSLKKIRAINNKYYEEIKLNINSKDTFYYYSIPDYYLYRIYYNDKNVYFDELTSDSVWREFYLPNDKVYYNF